jgi:hypothetical protein
MAKKKAPLPKKIAGVKVPKMVRKSRMLRAMLRNPMGRDLLANALVAGAGAAAAVLIEERGTVTEEGKQTAKAGKKAGKKSFRAAQIAGHAMESAVSAMMGVVSDAAHTIVPSNTKKRTGSKATAH